MLVGIDFDNTIAGYDRVFAAAARREGLLDDDAGAATKRAVRDALRRQPDGEAAWMRLQGQVYGAQMAQAELIDGVGAFLSQCRKAGIPVRIVSHKTEFGHGDPERINLRDAARRWMAANGFFDAGTYGLSPGDVFFEATRDEKVERIIRLGCSHFIDDLAEVFIHPRFPGTTERILYCPHDCPPDDIRFRRFSSWSSITRAILDNVD